MLTPFQTEKLTYLYNLLDLNGNGTLELDDFSDLAEMVRTKLGYELNEKEHIAIAQKSTKFYHKLLRDMPHDSNQNIDLEHWLSFFDEEIISENDDVILDEYVGLLLAFIFGMFDENHDGYIQFDEYRDIFSIFRKDEMFSKEGFERIDVNGDGKLSRYELIPAMETFLTSDDPAEAGNWLLGNWEK